MRAALLRFLDSVIKARFLVIALAVVSVVSPIEAAFADANALKQPVLRPESFFGKAKLGYEAAQKSPEICAKLFCYCGCDMTDNHSSLLDCFTSDHGVDCSICQEEAIKALAMKNDHRSLAEIQKAIDTKYEKDYDATFSKPSDALKIYRKGRLWQPDAATSSTPASPTAQATQKSGTKKPEHPGCCSGK